MHFDLPDLRLFIHVAEAGSMTAGAKRASLSTAAASTRIKSLEGQLGSRLFYRASQGVELTPAGEKLLQHARSIMRQVEYVKADFSEYRDGESGHIRIFANTTAVTDFMPEVLASFLGERPGITIDLQERLTNDIFRGVLDGATDLGVTSGKIEIKGVEILPFSVDRLVAVVGSNHPLAGSKPVDFKDTIGFPYLGLHDGSTLTQFLKKEVAKLGEQLSLRMQVYGFEQTCRMIEAGVGMAILPESSALRYQKNMKLDIVLLKDAWATRERAVIVREYASLPEACKALIQSIRDYHNY
ncbi:MULTISPECIES: LysR family transcriptional regulator [unclassified Marinobacter]|uniref:LysR family transcriptional regulator n=1 Tax=unclassified Marinobacter TaxID=83889 RepID=UPI0000F37F06|nr:MULTISPECIES: LysR substrate-binding domain-containing protein [unclassified Marinobacter]EBA00082.1 transcriptional regulator, LysR family protein [Marinobacter sp. ELB17]PFG09372.1 DNA-binding transcriptional LysR family regulator [Marinobacter sp. LV10MA510-1]